jgi:hypothetical protein
MAQLFSDLCRRQKVDPRITARLVSEKRDFDLDKLTLKVSAEDDERRTALTQRAFSKTEVSTPTNPNISFGYEESELIADLVSPVIPGSIERKYPKWSRRNSTRIINTQIASDGTIPEGSIDLTFPTYAEVPYGAKQPIDLNAVAQSSEAVDLMAAYMAAVMSDLLMSREKRVADIVMASGSYTATSNLSSTNRWDVGPATSTADPIKDIRITAKSNATVGTKINTLAASTPVLEYLRTHRSVIAASGGSADKRVVGDDELKRLLGLEFIFEGAAKYDAAGNAAAASYDFLWGKGCSLLTVTAGTGLMQKCFSKTFRHTPLTFREVAVDGKGVRGMVELIGTLEDDEVVTMADAGYFLGTVIS